MSAPGGTRASRGAFTLLLAGVAGLRLSELRLSARNERALVARGGVRYASQMPAMRTLHAAWFAASLAEVWTLPTRPRRRGAVLGLAGLGVGMVLRGASQRALGDRWTATVVSVPGEARVRDGVFQWLRHPNYAGVAVEIAAVPLVHGAWRTAAVFSALDAGLLAVRVRAEERALAASGHVPASRRLADQGGA